MRACGTNAEDPLMLPQLLRILLGFFVVAMVRHVMRLVTGGQRRTRPSPLSPQQPPRTKRVHFDRKDITDAKFEDIPDREKK